ncbi:MAG: DNA replication/repair protein RecF [Thermodesulfobacteriota bacterium]|nr:MAG: DNA replication/repair protein RecF [Candidatus Dadabacteria bacterium]|tara:strand:+ start:130 stop:1203 length:1074 start_codon:yes stop_codon:yes gene_type:complete
MQINSVSLKNFRNYTKVKVELNPRINIFLGNNGEGKTNLLEAIWVLINTNSYRTSNYRDLVKFNNKSCEIKAFSLEGDRSNEIRFAVYDEKKKIELNGKKTNSRGGIKKILASVLIDKEFKSNLEKSARPRRMSLDSIISNISPNFRRDLKLFTNEIKRKNEILKTSKNKEVLDFIDSRLISHSTKLSKERMLWISRLTVISKKVFQKLDKSLILDFEFKSDSLNKDELKLGLKNNREKELNIRKSIIGSHKDVISFNLNGINLLKFGSEGEKKTLSMAIKISEILLLKKVTNKFPIILIDEIGSEFDEKRFNFFYNFITGLNTQCFITANNKNILKKIKINSSIFSIINGDCKKIS